MIQAIRIRMVPVTQWIGVFLALGIIFRATGLTVQSLWIDEVESVIIVDQPIPESLSVLFATMGNDASQPLYFVFLHFWTKLFGTSELALRSLSALSSIGAMFVFYYWARLLETPRVAVVATMLFAVSSFVIWYAQEARPYSLTLLFSCLTYFFYAHYLRKRQTRDLAWLVAMQVLGTYTSILFLGVAAFLMLHWILEGRERGTGRPLWIAQAILAALVAPFVLFNVMQLAAGACAGPCQRAALHPIRVLDVCSWVFPRSFGRRAPRCEQDRSLSGSLAGDLNTRCDLWSGRLLRGGAPMAFADAPLLLARFSRPNRRRIDGPRDRRLVGYPALRDDVRADLLAVGGDCVGRGGTQSDAGLGHLAPRGSQPVCRIPTAVRPALS
jgi:hypothetical protein